MSDHYLEEEPKDWVTVIHDTFTKHTCFAMIVALILGFILKPAIIGLVFLFWLLCVAWSL